MNSFIPGIELSKRYYEQIVKKIIELSFPSLKYSSGLIDYGSDVLGYDTEVSMDHQWGPRLSIFLSTSDFEKYSNELDIVFSEKLPFEFNGFSTNFSGSPKDYIRWLEKSDHGKVNHLIRIHSLEKFFQQHLGLDIHREIKNIDWLLFPQQRLVTINKGKIFHDDLDLFGIKRKLEYYPVDIWYYLMGCEWGKIGAEEAFVGRCGDVKDDLGSRIIASRIVQSIMNLCFLMEKKYIPYSKWFGTAFKELDTAKEIHQNLLLILQEKNWKQRERYLAEAYSSIAKKHNELGITEYISTETKKYYEREYIVISANDFAEKLFSAINDPDIRKINKIGNIDQITNILRIVENPTVIQNIDRLY